jgi:hypothetical protein
MPTASLRPQTATPPQQPSSGPVHSIRYLHAARALRPTLAEMHGNSRAVAATSLLTSLLLTCDAMPGVMNRLRRGGWVKFWSSQLVDLSGQSASTERRARSILRDARVLEERHLTSGEICMRVDLKRLLSASPSVVGAPAADVTVQAPEPARHVAVGGSVNMTDIRAYGPPELQTLSTTGTGAPPRMREAVDSGDRRTNDFRRSDQNPDQIDREPERPITPVVHTSSDPDATPPGSLSDSDRELVAPVLAAFSEHPSVALSVKANPLHTPAAQATSRRVAAMIREGVPVDALASATTAHLDDLYLQTRAVIWSPTYCEPAYARLHSDWTMRRSRQIRLREEQAERSARMKAWSEESADDAVVDEVMSKYRLPKPTSASTSPTGADATTDDELRRQIDSLRGGNGASHGS